MNPPRFCGSINIFQFLSDPAAPHTQASATDVMMLIWLLPELDMCLIVICREHSPSITHVLICSHFDGMYSTAHYAHKPYHHTTAHEQTEYSPEAKLSFSDLPQYLTKFLLLQFTIHPNTCYFYEATQLHLNLISPRGSDRLTKTAVYLSKRNPPAALLCNRLFNRSSQLLI